MKRLLIISLFVILASSLFAAPLHPTVRPLPAEGNAGNHVITDGYNYFVLVDDIQFVSMGGVSGNAAEVFFKYRTDGLYIYFQTVEDAQSFVAEVTKRIALVQPWNNPQQPIKPLSK